MQAASQAKPVTPEPLVLEPDEDPVTGQLVYAVPQGTAGPAQEAPRQLAAATVPDLVLTPRWDIATVAPQDAGAEPQPISRIPRERMAAASWDQIAQTLRSAEEGKQGGTDVELRPGGELMLVFAEHTSVAQPLSRLPQERMAAATVGPSSADVAVLQRLDPANTESWTPTQTGLISGWIFRMTPPVRSERQFVFLAFRSPSDGNAFRIAVLEPDMDAEFGHKPHMIRVRVGGREIPVICGPGGRAARDLAEVRTHAAKWMAYTSRRMAGLDPGFSR
jgi:hypothetical protein